jgi:hypothetical protein
MKALVGAGIQRKQTTGKTVSAMTASSVRQRIRRSRWNLDPLNLVPDVIEMMSPGG